MTSRDFEDLRRHVGHKIVCVIYGPKGDPENVAIECEDCGEVLFDFDRIMTVRELADQYPIMLDYHYRWRDTENPEKEKSLSEVLKGYGYELVDSEIDGEYNDIKAYFGCEIREM